MWQLGRRAERRGELIRMIIIKTSNGWQNLFCSASEHMEWGLEDRCFVSERDHNNSLHHPHHFYYQNWSRLAGWLSCHPEFCSHYRKSRWQWQAGGQPVRSPGLLSSVQSAQPHKPNGKNKICESLMCFLTVCIYNLQICWSWSWSWSTTSHVEANKVAG